MSGYSLYVVLTLKPGESAVVTPGVTVEKPEVQIESMRVNDAGNLIISYTDGNERNAGRVRGEDGQMPSNAVIQDAVNDYCSRHDNCEGDTPSQAAVLAAVTEYCKGGKCNGEDGTDGANASPITTEQIYAQVALYCANNQCKGEPGAVGAVGATGTPGARGADGRSMMLACILVTENNVDVRYYSAKYTDEANTALLTWPYKSRLPGWFVPNNCIDMRAV